MHWKFAATVPPSGYCPPSAGVESVIVGGVTSGGAIVVVDQIGLGGCGQQSVDTFALIGDVTIAVVVKPGSLTLEPPSFGWIVEKSGPVALRVRVSAGSW